MKIDSHQLKLLREFLHWKRQEEMHKTLYEEANKKFVEAFKELPRERIPANIIEMVLYDKNGSGAAEILRDNGVRIEE